MTKRKRTRVKKITSGVLPNGEPSVIDDAYLLAWQEFTTPLQKALVSEVLTYHDTKIMLRDAETAAIYTLPLPVAQRIVDMYTKDKMQEAV